MNKPLDKIVTVSSNIITCLNKVCDVLLWVPFALKLLKFEELIAGGHFEAINPYRVRLGISKGRLSDNIILFIEFEYDELLKQLSLFALEYLKPKCSSRSRVFLRDSTTLLPPSEALALDFFFGGVEDPKIGVGADNTGCVCYPSKLALLLVAASKLLKVTPRMFSTSAKNFKSAALEVINAQIGQPSDHACVQRTEQSRQNRVVDMLVNDGARNLKLKEISDYVDSSEDVAKRSVSGDSEECERSGSNSGDGDNDSLSVPYLSRCIFVEQYDLQTIIDEVGYFPAEISVRSRMAAYREFKQIFVDQELKKRFKRSYFGHLRNLPEHLKFNGQLVHYLLLQRVKNDKMCYEMWFCINNKPACFSLKDFCLITGLNCSSYPGESKMKKVLAKGDNFCFKVTKKKNIMAANLLHLIRGNKLNEDQKFKCCLLRFLHTMLLAKDSTKIWIYEAFPHLREFAGKLMDEPLPIPHILKWHTSKRDKIIEGDPFKYKGKVTENVHPYIIPTIREMKIDYMITFDPYTDKVKNNVLDGFKKELERVTILTLNEDSDDDGDLGGNPVGVLIGDDDSPRTSKDAVGTSSPGDLHKHVAALEEAVLDIAAYIKEKRMKKKENNE
ncbi:hypothetical protein FXO37_06515 [Capsicum annuum]|nr:hypothetical protein FXO37_06515 [Capsicum annuum]